MRRRTDEYAAGHIYRAALSVHAGSGPADGHYRARRVILLGLLLPIVSVTLSLLLIHRLERRFGIRRIGQTPR